MKKLLYLILCLGLFQFNCSDPVENDYSDPCDKGTFVTDEISTGSLLWSMNTNELFAAGDEGIFCIDMVTNSIRAIEPTTDVIIAKLSPDGNRIYYMLAGNIEIDNNTGPLYSISIDGQDRQFHIEEVSSSNDEFSFLLSPDNLHIAYTTIGDSLHIFDIQNNTSISLDIEGFPIAFAPDSRRLLYEYGGETYSLVSIEDGQTETITYTTDSETWTPMKFLWFESGLYLYYQPEVDQCVYHNITTGETIFSWEINAWRDRHYFSPDGKMILNWEHMGWNTDLLKLYCIDPISKRVTVVACAKSESSIHKSAPAISHDNTKAAYGINGQIYMTQLP